MNAPGFVSAGQLRDIVDGGRRLGMTPLALWIGYLEVGGDGSLADVTGWLSGADPLSVRDYDLLAQAVNDRFVVLGLDHPVPYSRE